MTRRRSIPRARWPEVDVYLGGRDWVDPSRTHDKVTHPYSYSEFFIFRTMSREEMKRQKIGADYSDRLWQWDPDKFEAASKPFAKRFDEFTPADCSKFLSDYFGTPKECVALAEGCNVSNGYPYWIFWYRDKGGCAAS